ncbi:unnamed protein product [Polarella glacialis]|uniref:Uncharacterized protein n=1 Tax=Polarella glacialis TaxID=89957 RepID=A0A813FSE2_POLGL|nr:unnamed protein product [Polarella glacialis]
MPPQRPLRCWDGAVSSGALKPIEAEARALWAAAGGSRRTARSFWLGVDEVPRCGLEELALAIVQFHFPTAAARRQIIGAEFWVQLRSKSGSRKKRGLELHFDKDEIAFKTWGIWSHPELASVTYLTDGGAPLVVFATASTEGQEGASEEEQGERPSRTTQADSMAGPSRSWVCFPRAARHATFDGRFLHGIPAELQELQEDGGSALSGRSTGDRLSLLVNVWTSHRPEGVSRIPARLASHLKASFAGPKEGSGRRPRRPLALKRGTRPLTAWRCNVESGSRKSGLHMLSEHLPGDTGPLPLQPLLRAREGKAGLTGMQLHRPSARGLLAVNYIKRRRKAPAATGRGQKRRRAAR